MCSQVMLFSEEPEKAVTRDLPCMESYATEVPAVRFRETAVRNELLGPD